MQLAGQPAGVALVRQDAADQAFVIRDLLPVLATACRARITSSQERRPARRANRALTIGTLEGDALAHQPVDVGGAGELVAQRADGVIPLLIRAEPKNVGASWFGHVESIDHRQVKESD